MYRKNDLRRWLVLVCILASLFVIFEPFLDFGNDGLLDAPTTPDFLLFTIPGIIIPLFLLILLSIFWLAAPRFFLELIVPPPISS